jgi:hypothetical protein
MAIWVSPSASSKASQTSRCCCAFADIWVSPTRGPRWVVSLCCDRYNCTTGTQVAMPPPPGFKGLMEKIEMIEDQCGDEAVRSC